MTASQLGAGRLICRRRCSAGGECDLPRRKYGHLRKPIPPVKKEKCRFCLLKRPCPVHPRTDGPSG